MGVPKGRRPSGGDPPCLEKGDAAPAAPMQRAWPHIGTGMKMIDWLLWVWLRSIGVVGTRGEPLGGPFDRRPCLRPWWRGRDYARWPAGRLLVDMAIQVMTDVWQHSQATGTRLLVLLAIADAADRETQEAYPGLRRIAQYARVRPRQVFAHIKALIAMGELRRIEGGHSGRRAVYQVLVSAEKSAGNNTLKGAEDNTLSMKKGAVWHQKRVQSGIKKGAVATAPLPLEPGGYTPPTPPDAHASPSREPRGPVSASAVACQYMERFS